MENKANMDKLYSLGFLLNRASYALAKALRNEFRKKDIDLPHSQFIVLRCVYYRDGLSQHEISALLCKDAAAIKRTIDNLEQKGLVRREQVSQRENAIYITQKGKELIPIAMKHAEIAADRVVESISEEDVETVRHVLKEIYNNSEKIK